MSESKHEIPAAMLDAATNAIAKLRNTRGVGFAQSREIAEAAFEAAGVAGLLAERERVGAENEADEVLKSQLTLENIRDGELAELFGSNYRPNNSQRIAELEAELAKHQESSFHPDWSLLEATRECLDEARARITELTTEGRRVAETVHYFSDNHFGEFDTCEHENCERRRGLFSGWNSKAREARANENSI